MGFVLPGSQEVEIESAQNGFTFQNQVVLSSFRSNLGVGLGTSDNSQNSCGQVFLGFVGTDPSSTLNFASSSDGINWSGASQTFTNTTATPQFGNLDSTVLFTFSQQYLGAPTAAMSSFSCPGVTNVSSVNYYVYSGCPPSYLTCGGHSTGSVGIAEQVFDGGVVSLKSVAQPGSRSSLPITYQDTSSINSLGGNWSSTGDTATIIPHSPHPDYYIAWSGGGGYLNIAHVDYYGNFLAQQTCTDWSRSAPSIAYFNGYLFVAWRGGNNQIGIGTLSPF
ncbi:MAG: hypothetical protein ACRD11_14450 [Terriglobia bacterium]